MAKTVIWNKNVDSIPHYLEEIHFKYKGPNGLKVKG